MGHYIFRDYRPGRKGQFTSEASFNRSQAQGVECNIHREVVGEPEGTITSFDELLEFSEMDDEDFVDYEFHGTGDTGREE